MPIGLTYSYLETPFGKILPNYLYLLDEAFQPHKNGNIDTVLYPEIFRQIEEGVLIDRFFKEPYQSIYESSAVRDIMRNAYPYEIMLKFFGDAIENDDKRNEVLIGLFNRLYEIDYKSVISSYCENHNRVEVFEKFQALREDTYTNIQKAVEQFIDFFKKLFLVNGYEREAIALEKFLLTGLNIEFKEGISGVAIDEGETILIRLGNKTYTTLFHELVHAMNNFFREKFNHMHSDSVCTEQLTKTNEGFANFVAYHFHGPILSGDIDAIEEIDTHPVFFSTYRDVYATLTEHGTTNRDHNFQIVYDEMKKFEGDMLTDAKAKFYYERFYRYFHYDQSTYMYPKELLYAIGYDAVCELFRESPCKQQLLIQLSLGTICL